ncbi:heme biosynthesis HemY N-terminal domain-containing protein [Hydrogenophaga sp. 5NK40-0174]|uniref:heme biosynthesis HemY N-terminal domain-containing protein n=1 Tax=Hydrogenophaga sp. 5NK40-0174 TaxID=3127649 RepID=UPI0031037DDE
MRHQRQRGAVRSVIWLLALTGIAVGLALFLGRNQATVTLFWAPYRFDVSFNLVLLSLVVGFLFLYVALRGIARLRSMPERARRWRELQAERSAVGSLLDALSHLLAGRFVRAQSAGKEAVSQIEGLNARQWGHRRQALLLSHLLVAESAQSLRKEGERDEHLEAALDPALTKATPESQEGVLLRSVRWAIEDRDVDLARARLDRLPQGAARRIQALRLKLRIARLAGESGEALEVARLLSKHKAFSAEAARSVLRGLVLDAIKACHDMQQLRGIWKGLDAKERSMPDIALAAVNRAAALQAPGAAAEGVNMGRLVRDWLEPVWSDFGELSESQQLRFVGALEKGLTDMDADMLGRIERTLREHPNNAFWQYLAGQAFMQRQLWGKAAQLLGQASHHLPEGDLLRRTWCSLAVLAEERGDDAEASQAWKKAAQMG